MCKGRVKKYMISDMTDLMSFQTGKNISQKEILLHYYTEGKL